MPIVFIVLGLVLVYTVPGTSSLDPKRSLTLEDSAIDEDNIKTFYAVFGDGNSMSQVSLMNTLQCIISGIVRQFMFCSYIFSDSFVNQFWLYLGLQFTDNISCTGPL